MYRRVLLASLASPLLLAACGGALPLPPHGADQGAMGGTLIVVRHTELNGEVLDLDGVIRAQSLVGALAGVEIDGIYAPSTQRNIDTVQPLADSKELEIQVIRPVNIARTMFRRQPGGTLVWVGDADHLEALWDEIGAGGEPPVNYGEMFIVPMNGLIASGVSRSQFGKQPVTPAA